MAMFSKTAVGLAIGMAGIFVGYCFYFDKKRRSDPDFKKKLVERRRARKEAQKSHTMPLNMDDQEVVQKFFLQEVELGEEMLASGNVEGGIEHLGNAVAVCGQPTELLKVLYKTLPKHVFQLLILKLPESAKNLGGQRVMTEEDVE